MSTPTVQCVSIVSPDDSLFYIKKYANSKDKDDIVIDTNIFLAIDVFRQKQSRFLVTQKNDRLYQYTKDPSVICYGNKTQLGYKIIVMFSLEPTASQNKEIQGQVQNLCDSIRDELFNSFMNPFYAPFSPTNSPVLKAKIDELVKKYFPT